MSKSECNQSDDFQQVKPFKAKYTKTSMKKKELLIEMVLNQNFSIYRASKKLKISNSTAKSIITNYNKYGTILERNTKSSIQKIFTSTPNQEQKEVGDQNIRELANVKQQEVDQPVFTVGQEERRRIIQKMGITPESYPFVQFPFPFFYQFYAT